MPDKPTQNSTPPGSDSTGAQTGRASSSSTIVQRPSFTERSRNIGERIIEMGIFCIATLSIVFIFLIFFFIFREASPIFFEGAGRDTTSVAIDQYLLPGETLPADTGTATPAAGNPGITAADTAPGSTAPGSSAPGGSAPGSDTGTAQGTGDPADTGTLAAGGNDTTAGNATTGDTAGGATPAPIPSGDTANPSPAAPAGAPERPWFVDEDYPLLEHNSPVKVGYLLHDNWQPNSDHPRYGIYPIVVGTLKTTFVALLVATPIAILAALYTAFFAPRRLREILKPIIEVLAGFPSVVIGFFCLMTIASIVQAVTGTPYRLNAVVGGLGLALAVIPIIYTITDDALRAVPLSLREAALAIGASEWQAAYQIMLPAATPGIVAAVLLGLGRAFGETMIALMATGNAGTFNWNFFEPVRTFAATIGAEMGEVVFGSPHYQILFLLGIILFIFSFAINFVTEFYVKQRLIKKFRGAE